MTEFMYKVEQGIPMPRQGSGRPKYPWRRLKVGQSFLVPCAEQDLGDLMNSLTRCGHSVGATTGFKFALRTIYGGIRVWRIL